LLFKESIHRRIREESIRHEVVIKWREFSDLKRQSETHSAPAVDQNRTARLADDVKQARKDWNKAHSSTQSALKALGKAQTNRNSTDPLLRTTPEDVQVANTRVSNAQTTETEFLTLLRDAEKRANDNDEANAGIIKKTVIDPLQAIKIGLEQIKRLSLSEHELKIAEDWTFRDAKYDFIQQLRVLSDLRYNIGPDWPDATTDEKAQLEQQFNLKFDWNSHINESRLYFIAWSLVFAFSFIVPMMSFLYKILLPRELADYYSSAFQRSFGNPEARAYEEARKQTERERELRLDESSVLP